METMMQVSEEVVRAAYRAYCDRDREGLAVAIRAALEAALAAMWQDISTAPKDGERILLGWHGEMSAEGFWHDGSKNHYKREGWYFADDDLLTGRPCDPKCWMLMPLPQPPRHKEG
jgi:hypothetical protein